MVSGPRLVLVVAALFLANGASHELEEELRRVPSGPNGKDPGFPGDGGGFGMPGGGFGIPGWGGGNGIPGFSGPGGNVGGGWGAGYGGPRGGYARGGTKRPSVVCRERGPCYNKRLTCPAKCFYSYSRSGKNYGAGGGGGGCTIDCKKKCLAYC